MTFKHRDRTESGSEESPHQKPKSNIKSLSHKQKQSQSQKEIQTPQVRGFPELSEARNRSGSPEVKKINKSNNQIKPMIPGAQAEKAGDSKRSVTGRQPRAKQAGETSECQQTIWQIDTETGRAYIAGEVAQVKQISAMRQIKVDMNDYRTGSGSMIFQNKSQRQEVKLQIMIMTQAALPLLQTLACNIQDIKLVILIEVSNWQ